MNEILYDAIESARSCREQPLRGVAPIDDSRKPRYYSHDAIRALLLAVVRELPDDMSIAELRDELEIANNQ